jgi:hypothetical protein
MQIEVSTQGNLAGQLKNLSDETALLKEDLAFQTLMTSGGNEAPGVTINRFRVRPDASGEYRTSCSSFSAAKQRIQGRLQLVVDLVQDGVSQILLLPRSREKSDPYSLSFKFYHRVEGGFVRPIK